MTQLISYPMRLALDGTMAQVEQGSDTETEEQITVAVLTKSGERPTVPTFGIDDPAFEGFETANLQRHVNDFGPDIDVEAVRVERTGDNRQLINVQWDRAEGDDEEDLDDEPERTALT